MPGNIRQSHQSGVGENGEVEFRVRQTLVFTIDGRSEQLMAGDVIRQQVSLRPLPCDHPVGPRTDSMPLILTQNDMTLSGHDYADELGRTYEYPTRYRSKIIEGERFVYYRGRRTPEGQNRPQAYLGHGRVGSIEPTAGGRLRCAIEGYVEFPDPRYFRVHGAYLEPAAASYGAKAGLYFRTGVRVVPTTVFDRIVSLGMGRPDPEA